MSRHLALSSKLGVSLRNIGILYFITYSDSLELKIPHMKYTHFQHLKVRSLHPSSWVSTFNLLCQTMSALAYLIFQGHNGAK